MKTNKKPACLILMSWMVGLIGIIGAVRADRAQASDAMAEFTALQLPFVQHEPWRFTKFPIIAWWGPPGTATLEDFQRYKDAGFNLYAANPDAGFDHAMRFAKETGLDVMPFRQGQGFILKHRKVDYDKHGIEPVGWITNDEPQGPAAVMHSIRAVHELMRQDPTRWTLFNMLPPFAQGQPDTEAVIDVAVRNGLPILSYDHYIMMADGSTQQQPHFAHLELFRRKSLEHDVPFWAFALTVKHAHYRRPSESDVRYKQFTNLAYGAKGLWYFTYWGPTDWEGWDKVAIVDPADGSPTELYDVVKDINQAVLQVGDTLLKLRSTAVVHNRPPDAGKPFTPDTYWITDLHARNILIGFFEDPEGSQYAMVVNKRHGMDKTAAELTDTVTLHFADNVVRVEVLSWLDGETGDLLMLDHQATLNIAGGTGVLLKAVDAPTGR